MDHSGIRRKIHGTVVGRRAPIDELFAASEAADGLDTRLLDPGDTLLIRTCHSAYRVRLIDPHAGTGIASSDGKILTSETTVRLLGASLSGRGSMLRLGWVLVGFKLVIRSADGEILTSRVRALALNGTPMCGGGSAIH